MRYNVLYHTYHAPQEYHHTLIFCVLYIQSMYTLRLRHILLHERIIEIKEKAPLLLALRSLELNKFGEPPPLFHFLPFSGTELLYDLQPFSRSSHLLHNHLQPLLLIRFDVYLECKPSRLLTSDNYLSWEKPKRILNDLIEFWFVFFISLLLWISNFFFSLYCHSHSFSFDGHTPISF